jgi:hypothetical protein
MKIVVELSEEPDRIKKAMDEGGYNNPGQFVDTAIANQVELELSSESNCSLQSFDNAISKREDSSSEINPSESSPSSDSQHPEQNLLKPPENTVPTIPSPNPDRLDTGPLWGQYNRIFPVKLTVRALANKLSESSDVSNNGKKFSQLISLGTFSERVAEISREFGLQVKSKDQEYSRSQGEKLSAALPIGDNPEKSKERFKTHFVGRAEQGGDLTGAAPHLLFVNIPSDSSGEIGLTEAGLEFARLTNPLIDDGIDSETSLSDKEVQFYIQHVAHNRNDEFAAMQTVAVGIQNGKDRPDSLTEHIASINNDWTYSQAQTVRSGLVSRMFELRLIRRERIGQRGVQYQLTTGSEEVLDLHE